MQKMPNFGDFYIENGRFYMMIVGNWPAVVKGFICTKISQADGRFLKILAKDRDTIFHMRGPWANRVTSKASQDLEGGLGYSPGKISDQLLQIWLKQRYLLYLNTDRLCR